VLAAELALPEAAVSVSALRALDAVAAPSTSSSSRRPGGPRLGLATCPWCRWSAKRRCALGPRCCRSCKSMLQQCQGTARALGEPAALDGWCTCRLRAAKLGPSRLSAFLATSRVSVELLALLFLSARESPSWPSMAAREHARPTRTSTAPARPTRTTGAPTARDESRPTTTRLARCVSMCHSPTDSLRPVPRPEIHWPSPDALGCPRLPPSSRGFARGPCLASTVPTRAYVDRWLCCAQSTSRVLAR